MVVVGLAAGPALVAAGYWLGLAALVAAGALTEIVGAAALVAYAALTIRARGRWTTDRGWHRAAIWHLTGAIGWFGVSVAIAATLAIRNGADPSGWSGKAVAVPFAAGFVVQAIVGAWTHLVPSIGPGDPVAHARQRRILGRAAEARVIAYEIATAALAAGLAMDTQSLTHAGAAGLAVVALVELALLVRSAQEGRLALVARLDDAVQRR